MKGIHKTFQHQKSVRNLQRTPLERFSCTISSITRRTRTCLSNASEWQSNETKKQCRGKDDWWKRIRGKFVSVQKLMNDKKRDVNDYAQLVYIKCIATNGECFLRQKLVQT